VHRAGGKVEVFDLFTRVLENFSGHVFLSESVDRQVSRYSNPGDKKKGVAKVGT